MLIRLPNLKFVITTRGNKGSLMLERSVNGEDLITYMTEKEYVVYSRQARNILNSIPKNQGLTMLLCFVKMYTDASELEEQDVETLLESLQGRVDGAVMVPTCISSKVMGSSYTEKGNLTFTISARVPKISHSFHRH